MDRRFSKLFNLSEEQAIAILDAPLDPMVDGNPRYTAAAHLVNCPSVASIQALMRAIEVADPSLDNRIVRRKAVESLGRLRATIALPLIQTCLGDNDCYLVENAVWAIGEIGTDDSDILADIAQLLKKPGQTYRVIIHTLAKLGYASAVDDIRPFMAHEELPIASAAIATVSRFTQDYSHMPKVVALLQHPKVLTRRLAIQDLMDAQYYDAISAIAKCPVSLVFRLRGIRYLAQQGLSTGDLPFEQIQPSLEQALYDHPRHLDLVQHYNELPNLDALVRDLYDTDFGRCYLATQTILDHYPETAPTALLANYEAEASNDYGAHFHIVKLLGWLRHQPAYDVLIEALHHPLPQFQKSRTAAAIALGELGDKRAISELQTCLDTSIWDLKYATLLTLEKLGKNAYADLKTDDIILQAKVHSVLATAG